MEKIHRERIQVNYLKLSKAIRSEIVQVVKYLRQERLLSDTMEEDILYQRTPSDKAYKLLDTIQTRGPKAFGTLYKAVLEAELFDAANLLEPSKAPHALSEATNSSTNVTAPGPAEEDEPLPDDWPSSSHMEKVESLKLKVKEIDERQTQMIKHYKEPKKEEVYVMNQKFKGRVLIIDNHEFTDGLTERKGSSQDTRGLNYVLSAMNFEVWMERNKTKKQMEDILDKEYRRNFKDYGCFILIMLSHGVRGKVFGTDGKAPTEATPTNKVENYIEIEEVKRRIAGLDQLKGKPKLIIIQACQSDETRASNFEQLVQESLAADNRTNQQGNSSNSANSSGPPAFPVNWKTRPEPAGEGDMDVELSNEVGATDKIDSDQTQVKEIGEGSDSPDGKDRDSNSGSLAADSGNMDNSLTKDPPQGSDMFTALATIEGHPSYRNTAFGSWFIQAFIYVLANYAHKHELSGLMRKVTQLVMKARSRKDESQVCETRFTMDKEFYFFPGLTSN